MNGFNANIILVKHIIKRNLSVISEISKIIVVVSRINILKNHLYNHNFENIEFKHFLLNKSNLLLYVIRCKFIIYIYY